MTAEKYSKRILTCLYVLVMCLFCVFTLSACNNGEKIKSVKEYDRGLYFSGVSYDQSGGIMSVYVAMSGKAENKLSGKLHWSSKTYAVNAFYNGEDVNMSVNPSALYDELDGLVTEDQRTHDGVTYNDLKVVLRYDTIYKSIKSDASIAKQGNKYVHIFSMDETSSSQSFFLKMRTQNNAGWYSVLIASVLVFAVILVLISVAVKGKLWQKKTKKNE